MVVSVCCRRQSDSLLLSTLAARAANLDVIESRMSQLDNGPSTTLHQTTAAAGDPTNAGQCYYIHGSHASWKVLDIFFKIPVPGKSWKLTLKVLENPGTISFKSCIFLVVQMENKQQEFVLTIQCLLNS